MTAKKTDVEKAHAAFLRKFDAIDTNTDGICDLCGLPVDQHPCPEHQAVAIDADKQRQIREHADGWGLPYQPQPGGF